MAHPALSIEVTPNDQKELNELLSGGVQQVRVVLRAVALLQLAKGISAPRVAGTIPLTPQGNSESWSSLQGRGARACSL